MAAWLFAIALGCGGPTEAPNVVLISIDTLRADALGSYGGPLPTPGFDALAAQGVLFEQAVAPAPETAASHATLFTGLDVQRHGVDRNGARLSATLTTLAETFRAAGYTTAAFVSSFVLDPRFGWDQGFDGYDAAFPRSGETVHHRSGFWSKHEFDGFDRRALATNERVIRWLEHAHEPFFLFVHYFDPHAPPVVDPATLGRVPVDFAERLAAAWADSAPERAHLQPADLARFIRAYQAEVLYVDTALARLVDAIDATGTRERTLIAVTADHGEGLGQHGLLDHAAHLYEEQIHVPLAMRWTGTLPPGTRIRAAVGLVDIAPTLVELAGLDPGTGRDGRSLAAELRAGAEPAARHLFARRRNYPRRFQGQLGTKFAVRTEAWKYIRATDDPDELYDLRSDPGEKRDLHEERREILDELGALLDAHLAAHPLADAPPRLDETERRALEALGYGTD